MGHRTDKTRTEDLATDQRANRHPNKSSNYTEEAQNVRNDDIGNLDPLRDDERDHARNKAKEGKRDESSEP
ncbi:MAG TPA: hypothetical protein VMR70_20145 [Flavisolibacter sp.]|nr:hypothetical protein [Flavisolibacter sp.]